jgi:hypothetical protein
MKTSALVLAVAGWLALELPFTDATFAQKPGASSKFPI